MMGTGPLYDLATTFRRSAQYFFIRTPTAFLCAAAIGLRRRRATGAPTPAAATDRPGFLPTMPGKCPFDLYQFCPKFLNPCRRADLRALLVIR